MKIDVLRGACCLVDSSWNVMANGDAREGKWSGSRRMEWVASTLHTTSEHGVSSITTADAHTSAASSQLNWRPRRFKWTRPFRRKTKSGFCACAITFQLASTYICIDVSGGPATSIITVNYHQLVYEDYCLVACGAYSSPNTYFEYKNNTFLMIYLKIFDSCWLIIPLRCCISYIEV